MILEDDPYGRLRYSGTPVDAIKTLDRSERRLTPALFQNHCARYPSAYRCAPKELMAKMVVAKQCVDVHTNMLSQVLVYEYLTRYDLDAHIRQCCDHYRVKRDAMLMAIERYFPAEVAVTRPEGGLFLWITLPEGCSGMELHQRTAAAGVAAVPGKPFFADGYFWKTIGDCG